MEQGTISKWNVAEGDSFAAGDSLAVIETDKASMDFEAQDDGVVAKLLVKEGTSDVKVGTEIMVTVEDTADVGAFASFVAGASAAPASSSAAASTPPPVAAPSPKRDVATPAPAAAIPAPTAVTLAAPIAAPVAVSAAPSGAISLGGTEWGLLAAVKSPLAKMMANKQKEYIAKYGSSGHVPVV
jgi:pyruvate dehydrogenase E2 component (dihydrolipoamide acetyltransferase)